jgi:hypothetical protein
MRNHLYLKDFLAMSESFIESIINAALVRVSIVYGDKVPRHHLERIKQRFWQGVTAAVALALRALREEAVIEAVRRGDCSEAHAAELLDISVEQFNDLRCFSDIRPAGGDL